MTGGKNAPSIEEFLDYLGEINQQGFMVAAKDGDGMTLTFFRYDYDRGHFACCGAEHCAGGEGYLISAVSGDSESDKLRLRGLN